MLLVTDTGTFIISSIIFAKEELQNRKKIRVNLKIIFKNLIYHVKSCLPEIINYFKVLSKNSLVLFIDNCLASSLVFTVTKPEALLPDQL